MPEAAVVLSIRQRPLRARRNFIAYFGLQAIDICARYLGHDDPRLETIEVPSLGLQLGPFFIGALWLKRTRRATPGGSRPGTVCGRRGYGSVSGCAGSGAGPLAAPPTLAARQRSSRSWPVHFPAGAARGTAGRPPAYRFPPAAPTSFGQRPALRAVATGAVGMVRDELLIGLRRRPAPSASPPFTTVSGQREQRDCTSVTRLREDTVMIRTDDRLIVNAEFSGAPCLKNQTPTFRPPACPPPSSPRAPRWDVDAGALMVSGHVQGNGRIGGTLSVSKSAHWEGDISPARRCRRQGDGQDRRGQAGGQRASVVFRRDRAKIPAIANGACIEGEVTVTSGKPSSFDEKRTSEATPLISCSCSGC